SYAQKHALDLYTLSALLTQQEYDALDGYRTRYGHDPLAEEAGEIVAQFFSGMDTTGTIRIREQASFPRANQLNDFLRLLAEVFPVRVRD
ncbi:MAG: hypothetical protein LC772_05600, partial [Chloroflexi bacterium]|nr:hypothetical protein [Chloroflexota bacterium]